MQTLNYQVEAAGTLIASGPGAVTVTAQGPFVVEWLVSENGSSAPTKNSRHIFPKNDNLSMQLESGEHLWAFYDRGTTVISSTAENPAAGGV